MRIRSRFAPRLGWRAWLAALTVTVIAVAPLLAIFHRASVRHAVCEHGDWIEPDHGSLHATETAVVDSDVRDADGSRPEPGAALGADSGSALHSHAHCPMGVLARGGAGILQPSGTIAASLPVLVPEAPFGDSPHVRPVLSSAPKTSPPAFASSVGA